MLTSFTRVVSNFLGWRTSRKIVLIESDDWGSIRMPSLETYNFLKSKGINLGKGSSERYNLYDSLASATDFEEIFNVLLTYKDQRGRHPIFTTLCLVANPDFNKIREADFNEYFYEPLVNTLERYGQADAWPRWIEGYQAGLLHPEFHGREHLNVPVWMRALKDGDAETRLAFDQGCWGFKRKEPSAINYQAAFDLEHEKDIKFLEKVISDGLALFKKQFGYNASFFVPPNGPFNNTLEKSAAVGGIKFMSTSKIQLEPLGGKKFRRRIHWIGQENRSGQIYLTRNAFFEPSDESKDWVESCLKEIELAFYMNKPAIISTHRVNYIGTLNKANRERGLNQLNLLLKKLLIKWPDVEFMTSTELGNLIATTK